MDNIEESGATTLGSPVKQFSVFLQNRAGALLSIVRLLSSSNVFILGINVQDSVDVTVVRFVVSDPEMVEAIFMERGIPYSVAELIVVEMRDGAIGLERFLQALLNAETNIHFIYPILNRPNGSPALAVHVEDNDFAISVLIKNGFKLLNQEDLSR